MPRPSPRRDYQTVRFPPFDFASAVIPSIGAKPFSASVARFCPRCCTSSALGCLRAPRRATRDVTPGRARLGAGRSEPNATSLRKPIAAAVTPLAAGSRPNENRIRYAAKSTVWHYSASLDASSRRMPKRNPRSRFAIPAKRGARAGRRCQNLDFAARDPSETVREARQRRLRAKSALVEPAGPAEPVPNPPRSLLRASVRPGHSRVDGYNRTEPTNGGLPCLNATSSTTT